MEASFRIQKKIDTIQIFFFGPVFLSDYLHRMTIYLPQLKPSYLWSRLIQDVHAYNIDQY